MSAPTMKELCAKATPGTRIHIRYEGIVWTRLNDGCRGLPALNAPPTNYLTPEQEQANLSLAARCSPEVMLEVVELLERTAKIGASPLQEDREIAAQSESILAKLNATTL